MIFLFQINEIFPVTKNINSIDLLLAAFCFNVYDIPFTTYHLRVYLARSSLNWIAGSFGVFCVHVSVIKMANCDNFLLKSDRFYLCSMYRCVYNKRTIGDHSQTINCLKMAQSLAREASISKHQRI